MDTYLSPCDSKYTKCPKGSYISTEATESKYMIRHRGPPSQSWQTFLQNHSKELISLDFFTVPTASFKVLFVLVILSNDRRRILHLNVTDHPTAVWTARQLGKNTACHVQTAGRQSQKLYFRTVSLTGELTLAPALTQRCAPTSPVARRSSARLPGSGSVAAPSSKRLRSASG